MIYFTRLIIGRQREESLRRNFSLDTVDPDQVYIQAIEVRPLNTWKRKKNSKYLRKSCHHHIKCTVTTFLTALIWRRPLNSVILAATTHKGLKGVFDRMGAQVGVQVINKCKVQMIRKSLYNVEKPPWRGESEKEEENTVACKKNSNVVIYVYK